MQVANVIKATITCSDAILTALPAKLNPITMITEPTTTGGNNLFIQFVPINLIINAITV